MGFFPWGFKSFKSIPSSVFVNGRWGWDGCFGERWWAVVIFLVGRIEGSLRTIFQRVRGEKIEIVKVGSHLWKKRMREVWKGCYYVFDLPCYDYYVSTKKNPNSKKIILIVSYVNRSQIKPWSSVIKRSFAFVMINRSPPLGCRWLILRLGLVWHQHQLPRLSRGLSAKTCMAQFRGALEVIPLMNSLHFC